MVFGSFESFHLKFYSFNPDAVCHTPSPYLNHQNYMYSDYKLIDSN